MDNTYLNFLLAMAAIVVPLALAGLLVEFHSRQKFPSSKGRGRTGSTDREEWQRST